VEQIFCFQLVPVLDPSAARDLGLLPLNITTPSDPYYSSLIWMYLDTF
jgi:hypothetical protein